MRTEATAQIEATYGPLPKPPGMNVLALLKGDERYVFLYDDDHEAEVLRVFGRFACNHELTFTWHDAAVLSQKVRKQHDEGCEGSK